MSDFGGNRNGRFRPVARRKRTFVHEAPDGSFPTQRVDMPQLIESQSLEFGQLVGEQQSTEFRDFRKKVLGAAVHRYGRAIANAIGQALST